MIGGMTSMKVGRVRVLLAVIGLAALFSTPAEAVKKRHPAANEICFDPALSDADRTECKKRFSDATTADQRADIRRDFRRKVARAKAPPAAHPAATPAPPAN